MGKEIHKWNFGFFCSEGFTVGDGNHLFYVVLCCVSHKQKQNIIGGGPA